MSYREIVPDVYNVGCIDTVSQEFHVHKISHGTSYNSYLIKDKKICIIDTVKDIYAEEFVKNIKACLLGKQGETTDDSILEKINVIYILHTEPDHGGSIRFLYEKCPNATLVIGKMGRTNLLRWFPESKSWRIQVVSQGEKFSLGDTSLEMIDTPLLHWTDSTFAYMPERKALFSSDAFGQHTGNNIGTDSDFITDDLLVQMKVYYAQVFSQLIKPTLDAVTKVEKVTSGQTTALTAGSEYKADINITGLGAILPAHGVCILQAPTISRVLRLYRRWAQQIPVRKVVIVYESMYDTTAKMARHLKTIIEAQAAEQTSKDLHKEEGAAAHPPTSLVVQLCNARHTGVAEIVSDVMDAPVVLVGSSTFNNCILPTLRSFLHIFRSYNWKPKATACFGSYGWSPLAMKELENIVKTELKWEPIADTVSCVNEVDQATLDKLTAVAKIAFQTAYEKGLPGSSISL